MSVSSIRPSVGSALTCLATILVAGGLAELFLRTTHYGPQSRIRVAQFVDYNPVLGWYHKRNYTVQLATPDYQTSLNYDRNGIRGFDPPYQKPPGVSRVIVVGDSFVDGYTVDVKDRLTEVLGALLGPSFEVINLGVIAYSTDQELLLLRQEGWKYHPDLVVLAFYYNDVWFNDQRRLRGATEKPVFRADAAGELTLTNVPVPYPKPELADQFRLYGLARSAIKNSGWLYSAARKTGLAQSAPPEALVAGPLNDGSFIVYRTPRAPGVSNAWTTTLALVRQMRQETREHGAQFAAFYVPARFELSPQDWTQLNIPADYDPREVVRGFLEICRAERISCIEPSGRFREENGHQPLYEPHDQHWNAAGHHLAGKVLSEYVRQARPLAPFDSP